MIETIPEKCKKCSFFLNKSKELCAEDDSVFDAIEDIHHWVEDCLKACKVQTNNQK